MAELNTKEFIQTFLIDDIGKMVELFPYHSFMVMATGIEFLGKCISNDKTWNEEGSRAKFDMAFDQLKAFEKYKAYYGKEKYDFYGQLRCGMSHSFAPKLAITLSSKAEEPHLTEKEGRLNLRCEDFYQDFKTACEEVITKETSLQEKFRAKFLAVPGGATLLQTSGTPFQYVPPSFKEDKGFSESAQ